MPVYEYGCRDCGKEFTLVLSLRDHDRRAIKCPGCKSSKVEQLVASCQVITSKKS